MFQHFRLPLIFSLCCCPLLFAQSKSANRVQRPCKTDTLICRFGGGSSIWLDEDARWIITDEERAAFNQLKNEEERDMFIDQFWLRRDPTPDTPENEFKEEHYRRMAFANEQFASNIPGWKTDRGRIYILYGPPDEITTQSIKTACSDAAPDPSTCAYPVETWRYRYVDGVGEQVVLDFVDSCRCGEYRMSLPGSERDAIPHERNGDNAPISDGIPIYVGAGYGALPKFKELEGLVASKVRVRLFPFQVRTDFLKVTDLTSLISITIRVPNADQASSNPGDTRGTLINVYGRLTTMTGHIAQTFDEMIAASQGRGVNLGMLPLRPGRYRLDLALLDVSGDRVSTWSQGIRVPDYSGNQLATSSLILADCMAQLSQTNAQSCPSTFVGNTELIARVASTENEAVRFKHNEQINMWMQVYNLHSDPQSHKPRAMIEYRIFNITDGKEAFYAREGAEQLDHAGEQITLRKTVPAETLPIGTYIFSIKVSDKITGQSVIASAPLAIE